MKKSSIAVLVSLSALAGIASAQTMDNGIQMSHDPARAAQIEEHARNVQAQPAMQFDEAADSAQAPGHNAPVHNAAGHHAHGSKPAKKHTHKTHKMHKAPAAQ